MNRLLKRQTSWILLMILGLQSLTFAHVSRRGNNSNTMLRRDSSFARRCEAAQRPGLTIDRAFPESSQQSREDAEARRKIAEAARLAA